MKKLCSLILLLVMAFSFSVPAWSMYSPPSDVKPTADDLAVGQNFFKNLKFDLSKTDKNLISITFPKMDSKYIVVVAEKFMEDNYKEVGGRGFYQGSGGVTITKDISADLITGFRFFLVNDKTSACIALELYTYTPGDTEIKYILFKDRKYPSYDENGNIEYWVDDLGNPINEDGTPWVKPGSKPLPFPDVKGHWAFDIILKIKDSGYIKGYPDGTFKPDGNITRAEFAAMFCNLLKDKYPNGFVNRNHDVFTDLSSTHWSYELVNDLMNYMSQKDVQRIFGSEFQPDRNITREEVVAVIHAVLKNHSSFQSIPAAELVFDDTDSSLFPDSVRFSARYNIINGYPDGTFKSQNDITRAEIVAVTVKLLELL